MSPLLRLHARTLRRAAVAWASLLLAAPPASANPGDCTPVLSFDGGAEGFYYRTLNGAKVSAGLWDAAAGVVGPSGPTGALVVPAGVQVLVRDLPVALPEGDVCLIGRPADPGDPMRAGLWWMDHAASASTCASGCYTTQFPRRDGCPAVDATPVGADQSGEAFFRVLWPQATKHGPDCDVPEQTVLELPVPGGFVVDAIGVVGDPGQDCAVACTAADQCPDDGDACTQEACVGGQCVTTPIAGCCTADADCAVADPCSVGQCVGGACTLVTSLSCCTGAVDCDDGDACTVDACVDASCANTPILGCSDAVTACCHAGLGGCTDVSPSACALDGGVSVAGQSCSDPGACGPTGACCLASLGQCVQASALACALQGGFYDGDGSTCLGSGQCVVAFGACCTPDGGCKDATAGDCAALGGAYQASGTCSTADVCGAISAACCYPDGGCTMTAPPSCVAAGGAALVGSTCGSAGVCQALVLPCDVQLGPLIEPAETLLPEGQVLAAPQLELVYVPDGYVLTYVLTTGDPSEGPAEVVGLSADGSFPTTDLAGGTYTVSALVHGLGADATGAQLLPLLGADGPEGCYAAQTAAYQLIVDPVGACCLPDSAGCQDTTSAECSGLEGIFFVDASCDASPPCEGGCPGVPDADLLETIAKRPGYSADGPQVAFTAPANNVKLPVGPGETVSVEVSFTVDLQGQDASAFAVRISANGEAVAELAAADGAFTVPSLPFGRQQLALELVPTGGGLLLNPQSRAVRHVRVVQPCGALADCDDGLPCSAEACVAGVCNYGPVVGCCATDLDCLVGASCVDGACVACTEEADCDDGNACTTDCCSSSKTCVHEAVEGCCAVDSDCNDGDSCTVDTCGSGGCEHAPVGDPACCNTAADCVAPNPCQMTICYDTPAVPYPFCRFGPVQPGCCVDDAACDDGDPCTVDACVGGACAFAPDPAKPFCCNTTPECDDDDPSTFDVCAANACEHQPIEGYCPLPVTSALVLHEIMAAPGHLDDATAEWIELYNPTDAFVDLTGWTLEVDGVAHTFSAGDAAYGAWSLLVGPRGRTVVASSALKAQLGFTPGLVYGAELRLRDPWEDGEPLDAMAPVTVVLYDPMGVPADALTYGAGWPLVDGRSMERRNPFSPTDDAASWGASGLGPDPSKSVFYGVIKPKLAGSPWVRNRSQARGYPSAFCGVGEGAGPCDVGVCGEDNRCSVEDAAGCCQSDADCSDGNPCTASVCDVESNQCTPSEPVEGCCLTNAECDDGNPCNLDRCLGAVCRHSPNIVPGCCAEDADCVGDDPCVVASCTEANVCGEPLPVGGGDGEICCVADADCDDGDPSTLDMCEGGTQLCTSVADPEYCTDAGAACDDGDPCTADSCDVTATKCQHEPIEGCCLSVADCAAPDGACEQLLGCDPVAHVCQVVPIEGCCEEATACDDGDPCTTDVCTPANVCQALPIEGCCVADEDCPDVDGNPCTPAVCADNVCAAGEPVAGCCTPEMTPGELVAACGATPPALGSCGAWACPLGACELLVDPGCCDSDEACDDGHTCTLDTCLDGVCKHVPSPAEGCCATDSDCPPGDVCGYGSSCGHDCCTPSDDGGCAVLEVDQCVCEALPECCDGAWTEACVGWAGTQCGGGCLPPEDFGGCCHPNGTPGCDDPEAMGCVCAAMPECCSLEWTQACAEMAGTCGEVCSPAGEGDCCQEHPTAGCQDADVQSCVCAQDAFCCQSQWDSACVSLASAACEAGCAPSGPPGPCCEANGTPGCDDSATTACVCEALPHCCATVWDQGCVDAAVSSCGGCPGGPPPGEGPCCMVDPTPGCEEPAVEACVCETMPECCEIAWAQSCVDHAQASCSPLCMPPPGEGECCEDNGSPGCNQIAVEACVCPLDNACCDVLWDGGCAELAMDLCGLVCEPAAPSCCAADGSTSCSPAATQQCVCDKFPSCCDTGWDATCAAAAQFACGEACGVPQGDEPCCAEHAAPGCDQPGVQGCVCADMPWCCAVGWDASCVTKAAECDAGCP